MKKERSRSDYLLLVACNNLFPDCLFPISYQYFLLTTTPGATAWATFGSPASRVVEPYVANRRAGKRHRTPAGFGRKRFRSDVQGQKLLPAAPTLSPSRQTPPGL
ncbi:hypothetical protein GW574_21240 (plasmid) [Pantoea agglomerans]|uniref:hypothetical protein n=1 Tax=Enterobacter agglomerans TaxID=549 RepID=UPI001397484F|nr:hypothetical protein [Pantoea agglomerans]QIA54869.1 hypothetical protein GW574_21240 [Pantoea agglomerans]